MGKRSKLQEKGTRMSDTRQAKWEQIVSSYLESVQAQRSEPAKSQRFLLLLNELFGVQPGFIEDYVAGIERYVKVKHKDRILRGRVDNLFGNLVIEFERDLNKTRREAEEQLQRYVACLWSQEAPAKRAPYLCMAADGIRFVVYSPTIEERDKSDIQPEEVRLELVEEVDLTTFKPPEVYFWLDRYFLRKEILAPTTEEIVKDFGLRSHAFHAAGQTLLARWGSLKDQPEFSVVYESWAKYLLIVYGTSVGDEELFIRHTYLSTLAKLMAWHRLTGERTDPDDDRILFLLEGQFFKEQGIENFLEEDFFSWVAREEAKVTGVETARQLLSLLQNYNLRELSEDVLKSLYQELVDPATRHDLGEYYTPDWLAHRMIRRLLEDNPQGTLLDPSCGSGTFLYLAVGEKRERLGDTRQTLEHILDSVVGVDIHPLAVTVAKTNYILALGDLLGKRKGKVSIPIYLADTIRLPERWAETALADYEVTIDDQTIYLPQALLESPELYDEAIEAAKDFAVQNVGRQPTGEQFTNYLRAQHSNLLEDDVPVHKLFVISKALRDLIESRRDTIWAFVLKNIYKPLFLKGNFDFVVGNPPWIAFRFMEPAYQAFLKRQIISEYRLLRGRGHLITQMEVATLFLVRAADLYLKAGGTIAFVLPKSLFSVGQHDGLRQRTFKFSEGTLQTLFWREVWDCENVAPLFKVPACVLIAEKGERVAGTADPAPAIPGQILSGKLERKNASLAEAESALTVKAVAFSLHTRGRRSFWGTERATDLQAVSFYKNLFANGATIYPRSFWFVQVKPSPLGFNPNLPLLETADRAIARAKDAYKSVFLKGTVESRFLHATLLSTDLLPFGHLDYRLVVLPLELAGDHYRLLDAAEAHKRGFLHLAQWLEKVEEEWAERRGEKAERMTALGCLDYRRKLTIQNPQSKYRVVYPDVQRVPIAAVVKTDEVVFSIGEQELRVLNVVFDHTAYAYETNDFGEANYLTSFLNSAVTDQRLASLRRRKQKTHPHVHKKIFDVAPIPQFDPTSPAHRRLAELGKNCSEEVERWLEAGGPGKVRSIGKLRSMVREMLSDELGQIDGWVEPLLHASER
ncbi:MAG: SAM-dependent DNA methyltransferase [Anaerolineales bacterium]|nr:MAG: SAM-dependent DNA methyltransferase [Anaerolineales bacterium]